MHSFDERASGALLQATGEARQLQPQWNAGMIAASIAISFLGAFTSTQLMCQARMSVQFSNVLVWTILGSLTFGFCSIWSLHFVAMLACELDLPIGIDVPLTLLSAFLAVFFTFAALASDLLWNVHRGRRKRNRKRTGILKGTVENSGIVMRETVASPIVGHHDEEDNFASSHEDVGSPLLISNGDNEYAINDSSDTDSTSGSIHLNGSVSKTLNSGPLQSHDLSSGHTDRPHLQHRSSSSQSMSRRSDSFMSSTNSAYGLKNIMKMANQGASPARNAFVSTGKAIYEGCTYRNVSKGFLWSLAITSMHYVGIAALRIPNGYSTLHPGFVVLSGVISWAVCVVGSILMAQIETHFAQQSLFAVVACSGVAAMHFTGMQAVTFWSHASPSDQRGYPPSLAVAIVTIAITTCIAANFLLAHVATLARNKLAEIVVTRKQLWKTIAQKENAEAAAAARTDFIASASHEIRTPLHHLQGYSDLLSQTRLTDEGRTLLYAIQHATKTLSLITNNVLDWSKLEKDIDASCRPVATDMRSICESILMLLPNKNDEDEVELMVVVSPQMPQSLFLDETYISRIIMNLLSNALKFTRSGYILLMVEMLNGNLIATVKDTGSGIPPSFLPQLFEPFKQATTRGSQRGTGLGMSIIKQLLNKMEGSIEVHSRHLDEDDVEPGHSGSTFTVTVPVQLPNTFRYSSSSQASSTIAVFHANGERVFEGLRTAWELFGYNATRVEEVSDLAGLDCKYVWADIDFLKGNMAILQQLLDQDKWPILVPCDKKEALKQLPKLTVAPNVVLLQSPLMWHTFEQRVSDTLEQQNNKSSPARTVRFAPKVDILTPAPMAPFESEQPQDCLTAKDLTILLVEDNPINQRLGKKMLTALKYNVLTADDGEQAIEEIKKHDALVDAILMDQSMPVKDGVTATKEIRDMEAKGTLTRKHVIIAVTAVVSAQAQAMFKAAGADDFLTKPLSLSKLGQTLAAHLPQG